MVLPDNLTNCGARSTYAAGKVQLHFWFHIAFGRFLEGQKLAFRLKLIVVNVTHVHNYSTAKKAICRSP